MVTGHLLSVPIYRSAVMRGYTQSKISHIAVCFPYIHRWWLETRFIQTVSPWWTHKKRLKYEWPRFGVWVRCSLTGDMSYHLCCDMNTGSEIFTPPRVVCRLMVFVEEVVWQIIEKRRSTVHAWLVALMWTRRSCPQWYSGNLEKSRGFPHLLLLYNGGWKQPEKTTWKIP